MLCHPTKLTPPQQVVKYCGFLLDSCTIPCLRVPVAKRERALAIVDHLLASPSPLSLFQVKPGSRRRSSSIPGGSNPPQARTYVSSTVSFPDTAARVGLWSGSLFDHLWHLGRSQNRPAMVASVHTTRERTFRPIRIIGDLGPHVG
jgi:hypothetical protein